MIFKENFKIQLKDIGKENYIKNIAILEILENIGTHHSDLAGFGPNDIKNTGLTWILLDWKLKILKRPKYGQSLNVRTWGREVKKVYTFRDFEIYDEKENLCVIATSKWALLNINTGKIERITDKIIEKYEMEEKNVFKEDKMDKLKIPETHNSEMNYKVYRRDIDINGHMHNLYYLDLAYEMLPEDIYKSEIFDNVRIQYKNEIKMGDTIKIKYTFENNKHIITIYSEDESKVHAIIILY